MAVINTAESKAVLEDPRLPEPKSIWNYFLALMETPRGSGHQDIIKPKLIEFGKALKLESFSDEVGNVIIRKPPTAGFENSPSICLQAHYDMVAVKLDEITHNFKTDPLKPQLLPSPNEKYGKVILQATGTSLGADNGVGAAIILAILADKTLTHGPLEALFTTDEETSMIGVRELKPNVLRSQYLINTDNQFTERLLIGCAGCFEETLHFPLKKSTVDGVGVVVHIKGLKGGHSGLEIHKGQANACKLLAEAVHETSRTVGIQNALTAKSFHGGEKINVIPPTAHLSLVVPPDKKDTFLTTLKANTQKLQIEWNKLEPGLEFTVDVDGETKTHSVYDAGSTQRTLDLVQVVPHGVLRWSADVEGAVESSINFWKITLSDASTSTPAQPPEVSFDFRARFADIKKSPYINENLVALARLGGGTYEGMHNVVPAWLPEPESELVQITKQVYREINGSDPEVYAFHAAVEVGFIQAVYPGMKCIGIGPRLTGLHSPAETVYVSSVPDTYRLMLGIIQRLGKV